MIIGILNMKKVEDIIFKLNTRAHYFDGKIRCIPELVNRIALHINIIKCYTT